MARTKREFVTTSIKLEPEIRDLCEKYKIPLRDAIKKGIPVILQGRIHQCDEDIFSVLAQWERESIEKHQENIMYFERLIMDARVRGEVHRKRIVVTRIDEFGREYKAGVIE